MFAIPRYIQEIMISRGLEGSSSSSCKHRAGRVTVRGYQNLNTKQNPPIACDRSRYWKRPLYLDA